MQPIALFAYITILLTSLTQPPKPVRQDPAAFTPLFNRENLKGWYTFLPTHGKNKDPEGVFQVQDSMLHISGKEFGYVMTEEVFEDFHLTLAFKWGQKKWPPREDAKRDSGILYYVPEDYPDKVWPKSIECQIQEGDCGDFWMIKQTSIEVNGKRNKPQANVRIVKQKDAEKPTGMWNTVEVICHKNKCTHLVNGIVVNEGTDPNIHKGRILLQSEGAEIFYKDITVKRL